MAAGGAALTRHHMATFVFRCPNTGLNVQGWSADAPADEDEFELVTCSACTRVHLVNPKTGKTLGSEE
jgi:hypothetical protein